MGVALAPDLLQEGEDVGGRVGLVLDEDLDQIVERLVLELPKAPPLGRTHRATAPPQIEHPPEAERSLLAPAHAPEGPGALEERDVVELALAVLHHLLELAQRLRPLGSAEMRLGQSEVRVGDEARLGVLLEDLLVERQRDPALPLLHVGVGLHVEDQVEPVEVAVVLQDPLVERHRAPVVRSGGRTAVAFRDLLPGGEGHQVVGPGLLPAELRQAEQGVGHLGRGLRLAPDEALQEADGLLPALDDPAFALGEERCQSLVPVLPRSVPEGVRALPEVEPILDLLRGVLQLLFLFVELLALEGLDLALVRRLLEAGDLRLAALGRRGKDTEQRHRQGEREPPHPSPSGAPSSTVSSNSSSQYSPSKGQYSSSSRSSPCTRSGSTSSGGKRPAARLSI